MTLAKEALDRLDAAIRNTFTHAKRTLDSGSAASAQMVKELGAVEPGPVVPLVARLEELRRRLAAFEPGWDFGTLKKRDLRDASWILWNGEPRAATFPGLLREIASKARASRRMAVALIEAWLRDFQPDTADLAEGAKHIRSLLKASEDPKLSHWQKLHGEFSVFEPTEGPKKLSAGLLRGIDPPSEILIRCGFGGHERASGGYMMTVMKAVLVASPAMLRHLEGERMFQRIQSLLEMSGSDGNSLWSQPYLDISPKYLLAPWLDGKPEPANSVREAVQAFLLARLGDPWSSAKRWSLAGEDAQDLMKKWLTQVSLKIFFKLIREHALDSHWHYREAFWTAYLEHGAISEAWLVLGSDTRAAATSIKDLNKAYGFLQRADSSQSVLLLRVGSLVLCEWSHSGALRAWPANNKSAPKLRQRNYEASDLRSVSLPFPPDYPSGSKGTDGQKGLPHHGADRGYWQYSVARLIGEHTNIRLTAEDWMP